MLWVRVSCLFVHIVRSLKPRPAFQCLLWPSCSANGRSRAEISWNWTGTVCPKQLVTLGSCSGKRTALFQRESVPCDILHGIRGMFHLWVCCMASPTCAISITPHVTKCPWLDLVGICKPWDSKRDVCGRRGSCDVEQSLLAIPWLRSDFWEVARGDSTESLGGLYKDKTFHGVALCQPDRK